MEKANIHSSDDGIMHRLDSSTAALATESNCGDILWVVTKS